VNLIIQIVDFVVFCCICHVGGFGSMENTPIGGGSDLPTYQRVF
jgi:hypothetical protein